MIPFGLVTAAFVPILGAQVWAQVTARKRPWRIRWVAYTSLGLFGWTLLMSTHWDSILGWLVAVVWGVLTFHDWTLWQAYRDKCAAAWRKQIDEEIGVGEDEEEGDNERSSDER